MEDLLKDTIDERNFFKQLFSYKNIFEIEGTAHEWNKFEFDLHFVNIVWHRDIKDLVKFNLKPIFEHAHEDFGAKVSAEDWSTKTDVYGMYHLDHRKKISKKEAVPLPVEPLKAQMVDKLIKQFDKQETHNNMKQMADIFRDPLRTKYSVVIHWPLQFECLRQVLGYKRRDFVKMIAASHRWYSSGGQTNSDFYKTENNRLVAKCISALEFENFKENAQSYFKYVLSTVFSNKESFLSNILGMIEIKVGKEEKKYMMIMENITYGLKMNEFIKVFDLKGSKMNRFRKMNIRTKTNLDTNYLLERNGDPIVVQMPQGIDFFKVLERDLAFLRDKEVVDYSLLLVVHKQESVVRVGIIDYLRKYDLKKKIEHGLKKIKNFGLDPTIVNPSQYAERFLKFMKTCVIAKSYLPPNQPN